MSFLSFKWGSVNGWNDLAPSDVALMKEWDALGVSPSAMSHRDTPEQKAILCKLIDQFDGDLYSDWEGCNMSKEAAKAYVTEYGKPPASDRIAGDVSGNGWSGY